MAKVTVAELAATLEQVQAQLAEMAARIAVYENGKGAAVVAPPPAAAAPAPVAALEEPLSITEEELLAISAAIGAYLGVRAHIRQIRLVSSTRWAQEGRVSIQASHRLQG